ncbi:MAG: hypothetical protein JNK52_07150, partial [Zoogloeaceae bacterium]|nr:hypothetical protein [Zoogloeaceae bacterium]
TVFRWLARLKRLRGSRWDPFGHTAERRMERELIRTYEGDVELLLERLGFLLMPQAIEIAALPERIRGYGHVKMKSVAAFEAERARLLVAWQDQSRKPAESPLPRAKAA